MCCVGSESTLCDEQITSAVLPDVHVRARARVCVCAGVRIISELQ